MSRGVNKVILIGNLGKDPELTYAQTGTAIAKFSVATTEGRKNAQGAYEDVTEWHNVVLFGKTAEAAGQYLSKGSQVYIEGRIHTRSYEQDGQKKYFTEVQGRTMNMLGGRGEASGGGGGGRSEGPAKRDAGAPPSPPPGQDHAEDIEDDLPF